jgi:hypothetical protein
MAIATAPTLSSIVVESLKKAGHRDPASDVTLLKRAKEEWMQEIFNDIWMRSEISGNTRLKTLQTTAIAISVDNQRKYGLPDDFNEELNVEILDGDDTGTAQSGTVNSVTLESGEDISQANAEGRYVLMTSGTSKGQYREILTYNTTTLVATIDQNWDTGKTPVSGDTYLVINRHYETDELGIDELDEVLEPTIPGLPRYFAKFEDQFYFNKPFDKATYGLRLRYFANIHNVDLAEGSGKLITKIFTNWQAILKEGMKMKAEQSLKSTEYRETKQNYEELMAHLIMKEIPYGGELKQLVL